MTLVEMLVSLTIGSLVVVSVVSATRALSGTREKMEQRINQDTSARRGMEAIVAALRNVRRDPIQQEPILVGRSGGGTGQDSIDLLVIGGRPCRPGHPESDQYEVSFFLDRRAGSPLPALMCRKDHALDDEPYDGGIVTTVAEGIISLSFEYLKDEEWMRDWPPDEPNPPSAVRVALMAMELHPDPDKPPREPTMLTTVVAINVNQEATARPQGPGGPERPGGPEGSR